MSRAPAPCRFAKTTGALAGAVAALWLAGCASFSPATPAGGAPPGDVQTRNAHGLDVSVTILTDDEAERVYGVDLADAGLQAVWLRVENRSDHSHWLLVSALDANYFPADEAAILFHHRFGRRTEQRVTQHFRDLAIPLKTPAGDVTEGHVLVPRSEGGRYLPVSLLGTGHVEHFDFAVVLPDGDFDFESLDPDAIYAGVERPDVDLETLRERLRALPCCVRDESGKHDGDPLNLVLVGDIGDVLAALARGGWSFTHRIDSGTIRRLIGAAISGGEYAVAPISPLYVYGRAQDLALQRARSNIVQRNHLRLWLAPFRHGGRSVWVGQVSRDIGIKATWLSPTFTTHVIDPNVDEAREHLLQSLMVAGALERFAFVAGSEPVTPEAPRTNLTGDAYFTDGLRLVLMLAADRSTPPEEIEFIEWNNAADPIEQASPEAAEG